MAKKTKGFLDKILEDFGEQALDNHTKKVTALSTGSLSLDTSIGIGGIPKGLITQFDGPEGSGKTTVALNTAKVLANNGGKTLYIDVENLLNANILTAVLGEDAKVENITIVTPSSAEQAFMMAEAGIESGEFELIVIDSIGAMASEKEKEVAFDKDTMGQLPKLVGRFIKRNVYDIRARDIAVLVVNQVRDNVGAYIKSFKTPGGHQLAHQAAVIVSLRRGQDLLRGKDKVGILTKFVVRKNKLAPPFRSFTIPIVFGQGIDFYSDLLDFSKLLGVIKTAGAYYKFDDENLGMGKAASREYLINSKETLDKITETVYNMVNHQSSLAELLSDMEDETEYEGE